MYVGHTAGVPSREMTGRRRYDNHARAETARIRQRQIVEAAAELFLGRGYAETTIQDVARRAQVSPPQLVYAAFGGKAGLLAAIVDVQVGATTRTCCFGTGRRSWPRWV